MLNPMRRVPPVHSPLPAAAVAAGLRALAGGGGGERRRRMAARVARRFGARRVLFTDSGTSALVLALRGAAAPGGGKAVPEGGGVVALPAFGCYDMATAVQGAGAEAVLYDLEPDTLSPDPASLRRALQQGAGVVVVAHLYGIPVDMEGVGALVREADALLVEDAAQGVGASFRGRPLGSFGSVSVLSFGRGKGLTGGGGGALLAHDAAGEAVLAAADMLPPTDRGARQVLSAAAQGLLGRPALYAVPASLPFLRLGETVYRSPRPPGDMPPACLAMLDRTWDASFREAPRRRERASRLLRAVRSAADLREVEAPGAGQPGFLRLPVLVRRDSARSRLSSRRARRLGVMPSYPKPLHRLEAFRPTRVRGATEGPTSLAGAETLARGLFTLPVHGRMSAADLARVERLITASGG